MIASRVEELSTHYTSMPSETLLSLEEDENLLRNTNDEKIEGKKEKTKKEINKIINVFENFERPSVKYCMKILMRLFNL